MNVTFVWHKLCLWVLLMCTETLLIHRMTLLSVDDDILNYCWCAHRFCWYTQGFCWVLMMPYWTLMLPMGGSITWCGVQCGWSSWRWGSGGRRYWQDEQPWCPASDLVIVHQGFQAWLLPSFACAFELNLQTALPLNACSKQNWFILHETEPVGDPWLLLYAPSWILRPA